MKLFIIAFAFTVTLCRTEALKDPEEFVLLNPEFLTRSSWTHQMAYHALQDEIDSSFVEINKMVATELAKVTPSAIQNYSNLAVDILADYNPIFERIIALPTSDCKDNLISLIQFIITQSGFMSSNCIVNYNNLVQGEADAISDTLKEFSGEYGQVVLNVYKAYVGRNAMVDSEVIEKHINNTFNSIASNWVSIGSTISELRTSFSTKLQQLGGKLDNCFGDAYNYANSMLTFNEPQIRTCEQASQNSHARSVVGTFEDYSAKVKELTDDWPVFQW